MAKQTSVAQKPKAAVKVVKPGFIDKHALKIALVLGLIALMIRLYRIGYLSLWVDEYMHALAAVKGAFKHGENNGIILTWFNTIFAAILGHNEFAMRFPVALLGAALVPAVYVLGNKIANKKVGLMAAILVTFSLYLIFWSRVDRPYGMVATFYVPLILCFWLMLEQPAKEGSAWASFGINSKFLGLTILAFALSMMSQLICFLFIFTAGFYGSFVAIDAWINKKFNPFKLNIYNVLFYLNVIAVVLMFTPFGNQIMRPIIEIFLPGNMATLILPDLKAASAAFDSENAYKSYDVYMAVVNYDFKWVSALGWLGMLLALLKNRKLAYLLISGFAIPFLLMSFFFREPCHAKYLSYIYPLFLISAAYALYYVAFVVGQMLSKTFTETNKTYLTVCTLVFCLFVMGASKRKEIGSMLKTEVHGNVVDKAISEIHFVNWKQPSEFIKKNLKKGDVVMATVQFAPKFYLDMDSVVWFRQMHYDAKKKDYVSNEPDKRKLSATTYEQLVKTYNENARGWLLADYYFDNALTDPRAKQFVEHNFTYHFDACDDGGVKVFSWDKAKPKTYQSAFVIELGKNANQVASMPFTMTVNTATLPPKTYMFFLSQGIDSDNEAYVIINGQQVAIKANGKASQIDGNIVEVPASYFVNGENKIQFAYNDSEGNGDVIKGCAIYNFDLR